MFHSDVIDKLDEFGLTLKSYIFHLTQEESTHHFIFTTSRKVEPVILYETVQNLANEYFDVSDANVGVKIDTDTVFVFIGLAY